MFIRAPRFFTREHFTQVHEDFREVSSKGPIHGGPFFPVLQPGRRGIIRDAAQRIGIHFIGGKARKLHDPHDFSDFSGFKARLAGDHF